jgi:Domain of unknown function (DUF4157)
MNERILVRRTISAVPARARTVVQRCGTHPCVGNCSDHDYSGAAESPLRRSVLGAGQLTASKVPVLVGQALRSPGAPLQSALRGDMEARLGADFGAVRVHADATAAESAAGVGARAYAVGQDIVFGANRFEPGSAEGRRLLAHELVHVAQQPVSDSSGPVEIGAADTDLEREADQISALATSDRGVPAAASSAGSLRATVRREPESTSTFTMPPNVCDPHQTSIAMQAVTKAQEWLRAADRGLTQVLANPAAPASKPSASALGRHFPPGDAATARYVQEKVRQIAQRLRTTSGAPDVLTVECHTNAGDPECGRGSAAAYVWTGRGGPSAPAAGQPAGQPGPARDLLVFCPSFFSSDVTFQIVAMVHEIAHSLPPSSGRLHIIDRAYQWERKYRAGGLSPGEALTNAESYALFVAQLGLGTRQEATSPVDELHDCPADWKPFLLHAAADAERWNLDAQQALLNRDPGFMALYAPLCDRHIGGHSTALLDAAVHDFGHAETAFNDEIGFECEPSGGGRCDKGAQTYWYSIFSHLHVCPVWRRLVSQDDMTEGILTGMYGYKDIVDVRRARSLARLAREIHNTINAPPTAAELATALGSPGPVTPAAP